MVLNFPRFGICALRDVANSLLTGSVDSGEINDDISRFVLQVPQDDVHASCCVVDKDTRIHWCVQIVGNGSSGLVQMFGILIANVSIWAGFCLILVVSKDWLDLDWVCSERSLFRLANVHANPSNDSSRLALVS